MFASPFLPKCYQTRPSAICHLGASFGEMVRGFGIALHIRASHCICLQFEIFLAKGWHCRANGHRIREARHCKMTARRHHRIYEATGEKCQGFRV